MSNEAHKTKDKTTSYILLFLMILLFVLGIWKCPMLSDKPAKQEIAQEKEDSLKIDTSVKPEVVVKKNTLPPSNNETGIVKKEEKSIAPKSNINTPKDKKEIPTIENEVLPAKETTVTIQNETSPQKAAVVYKVDKNIDKRPPASSGVSCQSNTLQKITKSSIQTSVAFSPDGANFAVGNHDHYVSVMDMEGKELLKLIGHKGYVQSVKYSPDGKFIVTAGVDQTVKVWDASNGKAIKTLKGHTEGILSVAYSLNGKYIASGSLDHTAILWDAKSGNKLFQLKGHLSEIAEVTFSKDSQFLLTGGSDKTAKLWDVSSGKNLYSLEGHDGVVGGVAFTPDDQLIVTGSTNKIRLWNAKTGKHIHTINGSKESIMSIFISNDGKYITSSNVNGLIKIWQIKGGKEICRLEGHATRTREAVFHPTKKNTIVSASNDNTIRIWNFESE